VFRFRILDLNFLSSLKVMIGICYLEILSLAVKQLMKGSNRALVAKRNKLDLHKMLWRKKQFRFVL